MTILLQSHTRGLVLGVPHTQVMVLQGISGAFLGAKEQILLCEPVYNLQSCTCLGYLLPLSLPLGESVVRGKCQPASLSVECVRLTGIGGLQQDDG